MDQLLDNLARGWRGYVIAALIALLAGLPGMARLPVMDRDEARYAQATTQMLETGDYVRIFVQDTPRNKKPIGIHWMQVASVGLLSDVEAREMWAYRLPSLIGAMLAAVAAFWAGTALFDRRTALIGAGLFGAGILIGFEAMTAKTDAMLCGVTTLSMAAIAWLYRGGAHPKALSLVFWIAMGVGVLIKGPVTPLIVGLTLLTLFAWERRAAWMKPLLWWPGPVLAAVIVLPWMIAIGVETQGAFFADAIGDDLAPKISGGMEGHGNPPGYYLLLLSLLIFPATYVLPGAVRLAVRAFRAGRSEDYAPHRFVIAWALPAFVLFELLPTKLAHYTLPTYPALALLGAAALAVAAQERWRITQGIGFVLFALAGAGLVVLNAYATTFMPGDVNADARRAIQTLFIGAALGGPALAAIILIKNQAVRAGLAIVFALVSAYALRERILPEARGLLVSRAVSEVLARAELHPRLSENAPPLWIIGFGETSLVYETATSAHVARVEDAAAGGRVGDVVVVEQREIDALSAALAERGLAFSARNSVAGLNYGNGDDVVLLIGRVGSGS